MRKISLSGSHEKNEQVALRRKPGLKFVLEDALYFQSKVAGVKISGRYCFTLYPGRKRSALRDEFSVSLRDRFVLLALPENGDLSNGPPLEKGR